MHILPFAHFDIGVQSFICCLTKEMVPGVKVKSGKRRLLNVKVQSQGAIKCKSQQASA